MANEKKFLGPAGVERLWSHVKTKTDANATAAANAQKAADAAQGTANSAQKTANQVAADFMKKFTSVWMRTAPSVIEKGMATKVTVSWGSTYNDAAYTPKSTKVTDGGGATVSTAANSKTGQTLSNSKSYKLEVTFVDGLIKSTTAGVTAVYPMYFGTSTKTALTSDDILAMGKQSLATSPNGDHTVQGKGGQYTWLCVPDSMTINQTLETSGMTVSYSLEKPVTVAVTGKGNYKCYRSSEMQGSDATLKLRLS